MEPHRFLFFLFLHACIGVNKGSAISKSGFFLPPVLYFIQIFCMEAMRGAGIENRAVWQTVRSRWKEVEYATEDTGTCTGNP